MPDQELVVGGDADVGAGLEHLLQQQDVVLPHGLEVFIGQFARLVVDALAQPGRYPGFGEPPYVFEAAAHVGLDHGPDVPVTFVHVYGDLDGRRRVR